MAAARGETPRTWLNRSKKAWWTTNAAGRTFRHHLASLCASRHVAYRKALAWLGHSSSQMLDRYYHLHDEDSQQAMMALASSPDEDDPESDPEEFRSEDILRTFGQSTIEKEPQVLQPRALAEGPKRMAERQGFEPWVPLRVHTLSKRTQSAALAPLRGKPPWTREPDLAFISLSISPAPAPVKRGRQSAGGGCAARGPRIRDCRIRDYPCVPPSPQHSLR